MNDIGGALSWRSLSSFIKYLPTDSALAKDLGKQTGWETTLKTNALLADVYDLLSVIAAGKITKQIKPYPRPGKEDHTVRKIGSGPMTPDDLRKWYFRENDNG